MTKGEKYVNVIFDMVIPLDYTGDHEDAAQTVADKIKEKNPDCFAVIHPEHPYY